MVESDIIIVSSTNTRPQKVIRITQAFVAVRFSYKMFCLLFQISGLQSNINYLVKARAIENSNNGNFSDDVRARTGMKLFAYR